MRYFGGGVAAWVLDQAVPAARQVPPRRGPGLAARPTASSWTHSSSRRSTRSAAPPPSAPQADSRDAAARRGRRAARRHRPHRHLPPVRRGARPLHHVGRVGAGAELPRLALHAATPRRPGRAAPPAPIVAPTTCGCWESCPSLTRSSRRSGSAPAPHLVGRARNTYDPVREVDVVGLGSLPWRTGSGYQGLTTLFWEAGAATLPDLDRRAPDDAGDLRPARSLQSAVPVARTRNAAGRGGAAAAAHQCQAEPGRSPVGRRFHDRPGGRRRSRCLARRGRRGDDLVVRAGARAGRSGREPAGRTEAGVGMGGPATCGVCPRRLRPGPAGAGLARARRGRRRDAARARLGRAPGARDRPDRAPAAADG